VIGQRAKLATTAIVNRLTLLATLIAIATLAPVIGGHHQWLTGPIVNATLYLAVILNGTSDALMVGMIPSTVALSVGLLPTVLAPLIPFIVLGNSLLVLAFNRLRPSGFLPAVVIASFAKYAFLALSSSLVTRLILNEKAALGAAQMLTWPQFFTALMGGLIAYGVVRRVQPDPWRR